MSESVYICAQDVKNVLHAKAARRYTIALPLQKAELYENIIEEVPYQALLLFPALRRFCLKREFYPSYLRIKYVFAAMPS